MSDILLRLTDKNALLAALDRLRNEGGTILDPLELARVLKGRVKGQDHVIDDFAQLLWLNYAKRDRKRPVASVLFVGPTGTGKTELCKALAEHMYGDDDACLEFAGPELSNPESKARLIGNPPGYKDPRGQLTGPMINNPKRLVVFDEIDKAHPLIADLFLKMMGDGKLTEQGTGKVADFTQSVIALTSNEEFETMLELQEQISHPDELSNAIKGHLIAGGRWRPEVLGRIDRVYVYKPIPLEVVAEILAIKFEGLAASYAVALEHIEFELLLELLKRSDKVKNFGIRGMVQILDRDIAPAILRAKEAGARRVRLGLDSVGQPTVEIVERVS